MNFEELREIGFTIGEIKVYSALVSLQKSTITKIIQNSGVSSSKVYLILDKLIHKGLVNYIVVDNIKEFHITNPEVLIEIIKAEKEKMSKAEKSMQVLVENINNNLKKQLNESANIYRGLPGLKTAHFNLLNELNKGEEYLFFSVEKSVLKQEAVRNMYQIIQKRRDERNLKARGIATPELKNIFKKYFLSKESYQIKYHNLTLNQGLTIGKSRIILETAHPDAFAVEIISKKTADSYRKFFNKLWKTAQN